MNEKEISIGYALTFNEPLELVTSKIGKFDVFTFRITFSLFVFSIRNFGTNSKPLQEILHILGDKLVYTFGNIGIAVQNKLTDKLIQQLCAQCPTKFLYYLSSNHHSTIIPNLIALYCLFLI